MNKNKDTWDVNIYNKSFRLMMDKDILDFIDKQKIKLTKLNGKITKNFDKRCRSSLRDLLISKNVPTSWIEPLYNTISGLGESVDVPIGDGIHIVVNDQVITKNTPDVYRFGSNVPRELSIVVTKKVSKEDLLSFIRKHDFLISKIQNALALPEDPPIGSKRTLYALTVIRLRDESKKSFEEIATFISDAIGTDTDMTDKEKEKLLKMVSSADSVRKNLYDRFKKQYLRLKSSSLK